MSDKKQSSVEWFYDNILTHCVFDQLRQMITINPDLYIEIKHKAKAMHKEEIIESYYQGCLDMTNDDSIFPRETSEQYYNETFEK